MVLCSHLEQQDSLDIVPYERTTQSLLLNEAISVMFSPELTVIILNPLLPSHSPGHIKLCLSHFDYLLLSPLYAPYLSNHFINHQGLHFSPSFLPLAPLPPPTHCNLPLFLPFSLPLSRRLDPSPHLSPSLHSLSSAQLPVELDVIQEQADGSVIRSASLHSLSTSPC